MNKSDVSVLMRSVATVVREFVDSSMDVVQRRMAALEEGILGAPDVELLIGKAIAEIPPIKPVEIDYALIERGMADGIAKAVALIPAPANGEPGPKGEPGTSVTIADVSPLIVEVVAKAVADLPKPKDGEPGKSVDYAVVMMDLGAQVKSLVETTIADAVAALPAPKNGEPGPKGDRGESVKGDPGPPGESSKGEKGDKGDPGEPGKSFALDEARALIDPLLDAMQSKWALDFERRAQALFQAAVDKMSKPKDGADGFSLDDLTIEDDGHGLITLRFTRGEMVKMHQMQIPWPEDRGVFRDGETYRKGNGVTWGGSYFIIQKDNPQGKPGESDDFRLAVKRGQNGKDFTPGTPAPSKPVSLR
jgi:hypothetical protein